jgi:tetratricopeptide (TPR) repeat protein
LTALAAAACALGVLLAARVAVAGAREDCLNGADADKAVKAGTQLIRSNPRNTLGYICRGAAYEGKGDYDRAIDDFSQALKVDPRAAGVLSLRAGALINKGDYGRAFDDLDQAIRLNPREPVAYSTRGELHMRRGDYDLALADLNKAIGVNARFDPGYLDRGTVYALQGSYERALKDLDQAIRLNPAGAGAYARRSWVNHLKGDESRAVADATRSLEIARSADGYRARGDAYRALKRYDLAIADFDAAIAREPAHLESLAGRADTYADLGDGAKAMADYRKALALRAESKEQRDRQEEVRRRLTALQAAAAPPPAPPAPAVAPAPAPVAAAASAPASPSAAAPGRRVALVIGNADYRIGPLQNPGNDAAAVAERLGRLGFDQVVLKRDLSLQGFHAALREFARTATGADLGLIYYAGHGTEVNGRNYLIPVDATLAKASDLELEAVPLDVVLAQLDGVQRLKLVILDACRNNIFPLAGAKRGVSRGLGRVEPEDNTLVVYAAKDGTTADDGAGRGHSPFTAALLKHLGDPGVEIRQLFGSVRDDVMALTGRAQQPYTYGTLGGSAFYLQR